MNLRAVSWLLGCVLVLLGGFQLLPALVSAVSLEPLAFRACIESSVITGGLGALLVLVGRGSVIRPDGRPDFFRREGLAVVGLAWILATGLGGLPYLLSGVVQDPFDAFFEAASGFTTTGASVLSAERIDALPLGICFWRSFTNWLGGVGIVLVFVLFLPAGGRNLFRSEVPGIGREALTQRVRDSVKSLIRVYVGLTAVEALLLWAATGHPMLAVLESFSTVATGGFSTHGSSIGWYGSAVVELIVVLFMFVSGANFAFWDVALRSGWRRAWGEAWGSIEFRSYLGLVLGAIGLVGVVLWLWGGSNGDPASALPDYSGFLLAMRDAAFGVVTVGTTTGFATADFDLWPDVCRMVLLVLAVIGACTGSTGGGLKVVRVVILCKAALRTVRSFARPRAVDPVRVDGAPLDDGLLGLVLATCTLWALVFVGATLCLSAMDLGLPPGQERQGLLTAASGVIACLNNVGPGLAGVGPAYDFGSLPALGKGILTLVMILGRLEFHAVIVLVLPRFWRV